MNNAHLAISYMFLLLMTNVVYGQHPSDTSRYEQAYEELSKMLKNGHHSFKKAVFITENTFFNHGIHKQSFDDEIDRLVNLCQFLASQPSFNYRATDSIQIKQSNALFRVISDTITLQLTDSSGFYHIPYQYDFNDIFGEKDWRQTFVSKLLKTGKGNCRSLVYLYKILAQELSVKAHIALAPYHLYIKQRSEKIGWYNTELTSKSFPTDSWIQMSGYVHIDAIRNGVYMSALTDQESIALCVFDLAKGFERKFKGQNKDFIIKCCDLSLQYFQKNINAMLLKAETLKQQYMDELVKRHLTNFEDLQSDEQYAAIWEEMRLLYLKIHQLGYRQMPKEMYEKWLMRIETNNPAK